jgi:hypothetical protein
MATIIRLTHDRVGKTDLFVRICRVAERIFTSKPPLMAVWTLDCHGRLACRWEFDSEGQFVQSG